jgi:histidine triad (HIT) family protein
MSACNFCDIIEKKAGFVYEDEKIVALLHPAPSAPGHFIVVPRAHAPIFEQVPDMVTAELFVKANKISKAIFEGLGAEGTNVFVQNGVAAGQRHNHAMVHVIPRREGDGLPLQWKPKQFSEEEMSTAELKIKEETKNVGIFEKEKPKPVEVEKPKEVKKEDYRIKHLRRIP